MEGSPLINAVRRKQPLIVIACVVASALAWADPASAGTYVIRNCNVPGEQRATVGPWTWSAGGGAFANDDCAGGGGFGFNAGPMAPGTVSDVYMTSGTSIAIRRVRLWLVARLAGSGSSLFVSTLSTGAASSGRVDLFGPPGGETLTTPFVSALLPADTTSYHVLLNCSNDAAVGCTPSATNVLDIKGAETTLEESTMPTGSIDGGELMTGGPQVGVRTLAYTANDVHSGVIRVSAIVGKTVVGTADFAAECTYAAPAACPLARNGAIAVDTRKVPDGVYPVSLRVTDAAANDQTVQASTAIQVANGATGTAAAPVASGNARLTAAFAANRRSSLTVGYGRRVVVRGRLRDSDGVPIGGATVEFEERPARGSTVTRRATATTGPDGTFAYTVRRGTSRILTLAYRSTPADTQAVVMRLALRVKASASLRVGLNGILVRYRGRVLSKPLPRKGKLIEIQGRAPGASWQTFARRRTSRRGNFSGTYRLRVHRPGVRLQFRVRVPSEAGYLFTSHAGRPLTRIVRLWGIHLSGVDAPQCVLADSRATETFPQATLVVAPHNAASAPLRMAARGTPSQASARRSAPRPLLRLNGYPTVR